VDWNAVIEKKDCANGLEVRLPLAVEKPIPHASAVGIRQVERRRLRWRPEYRRA
jgi:hypothetical protein